MTRFNFDKVAFVPFENKISDTRDLFRILDQLAGLERFLFKGKVGPISQKGSDFLPADMLSIFRELEEKGLLSADEAMQHAFLKILIAHLKDLAQVRVSLAYEPTGSFISFLAGEISETSGRKVILDLVVNQYIMGGAIFEYRGKIYESTLEERLNSTVLSLVGRSSIGKVGRPTNGQTASLAV